MGCLVMASSKEMQTSTRPLTQHRQSISSGSNALAATRLPSHSRNNSHSHSALSGALNATHRVTRRKSVTNTAANVAAVAAALSNEAGDKMTPLPIAISSRRGTMSKSAAAARSAIVGSLPSPPGSLPSHKFISGKMEGQESAIDDDFNDMSADEGEGDGFQKARIRRASDGQPLTKEGKKSSRIELRCDKCGKGYKHSSCLTKHLWEHTPEWSYTSKLLISKHQQVQLLEAASVLVQMNNSKDATTPPDSAKDFASEPESVSPAASGYSDQHDGRSSADTTPPPQADAFNTYRNTSKRYSGGSGYSRSYQSAISNGFAASNPNGSGFGHHRQGSISDRRPPSSGMNNTGQEDRDLAATLANLDMYPSSYGSNGGSRDARFPFDAPPVPPVPAQYIDQAALTSTSFINSFSSRQMPESFTRYEPSENFPHAQGVKREESEDSIMDDDDFDRRSRILRSEEDDDGVFGRMEE